MRTGTFTRTDTVELVDKPVPDIGPTEVLLEVAGVGLCHSDLAIIGQPDSPLIGSTLGHEVAGTVAEVGTEVTDWSADDTAIVALVLSCGRCRACLAGRDNRCRTVAPRSAPAPMSPGIGSPGGMTEYIAVQARHLDPLSGLDPVDSAPAVGHRVHPDARDQQCPRPVDRRIDRVGPRARRPRTHGTADPLRDHRRPDHRRRHRPGEGRLCVEARRRSGDSQ